MRLLINVEKLTFWKICYECKINDLIWYVTWWKVFPRSMLDWPSLQSYGFIIFSKARHMNSDNAFHPQNIINYFIYLSPNHTQKEHGSVFRSRKGCPALQQMGKPQRQPSHFLVAVSYPCEMSSLLHSWSSREHKAYSKCLSMGAAQPARPTQLRHGKGWKVQAEAEQ